jgi:hypothetical protein
MTIRCSSLDRVLECNGSLLLAGLVDDRVGDEGLEGSDLHWLSADRLVREFGATPPDDTLGPRPVSPATKFSRWISDYYVRTITETVPPDWAMEVEAPLAYEFDVPATMITIVDDWTLTLRQKRITSFVLSGHIDCVAISPDGKRAIGFDLKTGYDPVDEAEQNWQMLGYIVLLKRAYPTLTEVTFYIVQPRNDEEEGFQRISSVTVTNLDNATFGLVDKIHLALRNTEELNTGRKQCKWCPAAVQCPAAIAEREAMKLKLTPEALATIKRQPDDATLADWVISAKTLTRPLEDADKIARQRIEANGQIVATDGTVITQKTQRGSYKVTDPMALWTNVADLLPESRRALCAKWSMTAIKDQIAEHLNVPATGKAAVTAETVFDAKLRPYVEQGERKILQFQ